MLQDMFNIHDPNPDDLDETLEGALDSARNAKGRHIVKSLGTISRRYEALFEDSIKSVREFIRNKNVSFHRRLDIENKKSEACLIRTEFFADIPDQPHGEWLVEYFLKMRVL